MTRADPPTTLDANRRPRVARLPPPPHETAMTPARSPRLPRLAGWLFASGVALYLLLSAPALSLLGISYEASGGAFFEKVHPGTWLIALAYAILISSRGHPFRVVGAQLAAQPLLAVYLACQLCVLGWTLSRHGTSGAAFMLDTLLMPFVCIATLMMLDSRQRYRCLVIVVTLLVLNTLLGLGEAVAQARLIPLRLGGADEAINDIFRPSALLGHPLTNSMVTATLLPAVLYLRISMVWRGLLVLLLWVGTLAFGGRTGFLLATALYGAYFMFAGLRATIQGRFTYLQLTGAAFVGMLGGAALVAAVFAAGIGERIFNSLSWDGSASVRYRVWNVFDHLNSTDLLIGISPERIVSIGTRIGLEASEAIENFWLVLFLQMGVIGFIPFVVAMACLLTWLWRASGGPMRVAVVLFVLVASSNNSLATKTVALAVFSIVVTITRRLPITAAAVASAPVRQTLRSAAG